jgi:short-subunit dehydrogenase
VNAGEYVLITGASSGIGLEFARLFAADKHNLFLVARNQAALEELAAELSTAHGISAQVMSIDLSLEDSPKKVYEFGLENNLKVTTLINNAGFAANGCFHEIDWNVQQSMIEVNVVCLTALTYLYLPDMVREKNGRILNVASVAAFVPGPLMAVYYATKAFVLSFSEAIRNEVERHGITVSCLCPGPTWTGFQKRAKLEDTNFVKAPTTMTAAQVAKIGYDGFKSKRAVIVTGLPNNVAVIASRLVPRRLSASIARLLQEKAI